MAITTISCILATVLTPAIVSIICHSLEKKRHRREHLEQLRRQEIRRDRKRRREAKKLAKRNRENDFIRNELGQIATSIGRTKKSTVTSSVYSP